MKKLIIIIFLLFSLPAYAQDWSLLNEPFNNLDDWTDRDNGGTSTQATFDNEETLKLDGGPGTGFAFAGRSNSVSLPNNYTVEIKIYCDALGTLSDDDIFVLRPRNGVTMLQINFASDGLFVWDGSSNNEVGTNLVQQDTWQTWRFLVTGGDSDTATVDVYLDGELQASDVDCSDSTFIDDLWLMQYGSSTANRITYVDYIKIDDGLHAPSTTERRIIMIQ